MHWMIYAVVALSVLGCARNASPTAPVPTATGKLVFDADAVYGREQPASAERAATFLETSKAIVKSRAVGAYVSEQLRLSPQERERLRGRIVVERVRGALVLDVGVQDPDPRRATEICNALLEGYLQERRQMLLHMSGSKLELLQHRIEEAERADAGSLTESLRSEHVRLRMEHDLQELGVRVLEPCAPLKFLDG